MKLVILSLAALLLFSCASSPKNNIDRTPQQAGTGNIGSNRNDSEIIFAGDEREPMLMFHYDTYRKPEDIAMILNWDFGRTLVNPNCLKNYIQSTEALSRLSMGAEIRSIRLDISTGDTAITPGQQTFIVAPPSKHYMIIDITYSKAAPGQTINYSLKCPLRYK